MLRQIATGPHSRQRFESLPMPNQACPDESELRQSLNGQTIGDVPQQIFEHLRECEVCSDKAESLAKTDTLVDWLRETQIDGEFVDLANLSMDDRFRDEPNLRQAIESAKTAIGQCGSSETRPIGETLAADDEFSVSDGDLVSSVIRWLGPPVEPGDLGSLDDFRILETLGSGGMGIVFRAVDTTLHRTVALKVMRPDFGATSNAKSRFLREARAMAAVDHENVVEVFRVGQHDGHPYAAMKLLTGQSLRQRFEGAGRLELTELMSLSKQLAAGLAAVHREGLIHRDVKPENIWIEETGRIKLLDFGLALADDQLVKTHSGAMVGTPAYMSPEQACSRTVDHRTDLFSLGSVLYRAASGQAAFKGDSVPSILMSVASCNHESLRDLRDDLPEGYCDVIHRLLAADPDDRYADADALLRAFQEIPDRPRDKASESGESETAATTSPAPHASGGNRGGHRRWWMLAAAALPLVLLAAFVMRIELEGGTVEIIVDGADTPVQVNVLADRSITITDPNDGETISVSVDADQEEMRIEKAGFATVTKAFDLSDEQGRTIRVRFIPKARGDDKSGDEMVSSDDERQQAIATLLKRGAKMKTREGNTFDSSSDSLPSSDEEIDILWLLEDTTKEDLVLATKLPSVSLLSIDESKMTGHELAVLANHMPVNLLLLDMPNLDDESLRPLPIEKLGMLIMNGTSTGDLTIEFSTRPGGTLNTINLGTEVTSVGLKRLVEKMEVHTLSLSGCNDLHPTDLQLLSAADHLVSLCVPTRLSGSELFKSIQSLPSLRHLVIDTGSPDSEFADLTGIRTLEQLTGLGISACRVSAAAIEELRHLQHLESLKLNYTDVDAETLESLRAALPNTDVQMDETTRKSPLS